MEADGLTPKEAAGYHDPVKSSPWFYVALGIFAALILYSLYITGRFGLEDHAERHRRSGGLKTIATAQADFRSNDRDQNGNHDFWTSDIAGLYFHGKLIEVRVALADLEPQTSLEGERGSKGGFWFLSLRRDLSVGSDYASTRASRFGAAALPELRCCRSSLKVFIINEGNTMFKRDFGQEILTQGRLNGVFDGNWPSDADLSASWAKMD